MLRGTGGLVAIAVTTLTVRWAVKETRSNATEASLRPGLYVPPHFPFLERMVPEADDWIEILALGWIGFEPSPEQH